MRSRFYHLAVAVLLTAAVAAPAQAQSIPPKDSIGRNSKPVLSAFVPVVAKARLSTIRIRCDGKDAALGAVVGADGWIVTKASLLEGSPTCVLPNGREVPARVVGTKPEYDLAMLKADVHGLTPIQWRDSKDLMVGSWLASPGPGPLPVAVGVVSVATRTIPHAGRPVYMPSPNSGFLGVLLEPVEKGPGVAIKLVSPDTPAERAGLKAKDVILAVNGQKVADLDDLRERLGRHKSGDKVTLSLKRGDDELEKRVTLGKRPPNRGDFQNNLGSTLSEKRIGFPIILQHDQVLKPTDCGGPVVDLDGNAVGINIARAGRTETDAIPTEAVLPLLFDLAAGQLKAPAARGASAAAPSRGTEPRPTRVKSKEVGLEKQLQRRPEQSLTDAERVAAAEAAVAKARAALSAAAKALSEAESALKKKGTDNQLNKPHPPRE